MRHFVCVIIVRCELDMFRHLYLPPPSLPPPPPIVRTKILSVSWGRIVGMGPAAEESLGRVGLGVFMVMVAAASGMVASCGVFVAYVITRQEYLLALVS